MVSIAQLLDWKPAAIGEVADDLSRRRRTLLDAQDEVDGAEPPSTWMAGSASQARAAHERLRLRVLDLAAEISDVTVNLDDAANRVRSAKQALQSALGAARAHGFEVDHDTGTVKDPRTYDEDQEQERLDAAAQVQAVAADIDDALQAAQEADLDLAAALAGAEAGKVDGGTGTLAHAVEQVPTSMDGISGPALAEMLGGEISLHTISAFLDVKAEVGGFEVAGKAKAEYKVMLDGTVVMALHLEAGLGREIDVGESGSAGVGAGATTDLELKFDSTEEANAFLAQLRDRATDVDAGDFITGQVGTTIARNVADLVMKQDVDSFRVGAYVSGNAALDSPWARGAVEGRAEVYVDTVKDYVGMKISGGATAELGAEKDPSAHAAAALSGDLKINTDGSFNSLTLQGRLEGDVANSRLGLNMPTGTGTGGAVDVQLKVDDKNPALDDIQTALSAGEMGRAKDLALQHGELIVKTTSIETYSDKVHDYDVGFAELDLKYGASGETTNQVWYRRAGYDEVYRYDAFELADKVRG